MSATRCGGAEGRWIRQAKTGWIQHVMNEAQSARLSGDSVQASVGGEPPQILWRYEKNLPARGRIGIVKRSYYEEGCGARPSGMDGAETLRRVSGGGGGATQIMRAYEDITRRKDLVRSGTVILKLELNL